MPHSYSFSGRRTVRNRGDQQRRTNRTQLHEGQESEARSHTRRKDRKDRADHQNRSTRTMHARVAHNARRDRNRRQAHNDAIERGKQAMAMFDEQQEPQEPRAKRNGHTAHSRRTDRHENRYNRRSDNRYDSRHQKRENQHRTLIQTHDHEYAIDIPDSAMNESYDPTMTFTQLGVPEQIVRVLANDGKTTAFPIQAATLPDSLKGKNILGRGRTGSGKTLAFTIPLVARVAPIAKALRTDSERSDSTRMPEDAQASKPAPLAMILAPTRELVHQIDEVVQPLAHAYGMRTVTIYGGVRQQRQVAQLRRGAQIVVACPGRLEDLLRQDLLTLERVEVSVLDEADEMSDMGFLPAVTRLLEQVKADGQRMLFSATLDKQVGALVSQFLPNPTIHAVDDAESQVDTMTHHVFAVSSGNKDEVLRVLASGKKRVIFFTRTKFQAKNLAKKFVQDGIPAVDLQGNLTQAQRDRHLAVFAEGHVRVLVATDVAARGIDISDVALVVQTEPPEDPKSFVHRSGRTARAGKDGDVVTLVLPNQKRSARQMLRRAGLHAQVVEVKPDSPELQELVGEPAELQIGWSMPEAKPKRRGRGRGRGGHGRGHGRRDRGYDRGH